MLTPEQETYILTHAYVPEHIVVLMTSLSGGEPFLIDDYFCCCKDDWVIFIGYPLEHEFVFNQFQVVLEKVNKKFRSERISLIAPKLPQHLDERCREKDSDAYYTLNTRHPVIGSAVKRNLRKAGRRLAVERAVHMGDAHHQLMQEFIERVSPPLRVKELFFKLPQYVASKNYVLGASDLLLSELIKMSAEYSKSYIHLGLGVNSGIRRFKEKWGAKPTLSYEMCELVQKKPLILEFVRALGKLCFSVDPMKKS